MNDNEKLSLKLLQDINEHKNKKNKLFSTPKYIKLKIKNIRFCELPKNLSNKLGNKIIKEALILGLREELDYNEKMKNKFLKYLQDVNQLKEKVKRNKEEVEENCEKLKQEFYDKFIIIENYEKQISLLNEEKKEIIRTNNEIISMKNKITDSLKKQINKLQKEIDDQRVVIDDLKNKILVLEDKKSNLDNEFAKILIEEEKKYKELFKEYLILSQKCDYYQIEYDKFDKYPEEIIKEDLNLFDATKTNDLLTEENLKIELAEKNFVRDKLMNSVITLHKQINIFEEKQKEIKEKEKIYGKSLTALDKKFKNKTTIKKPNMNTNTYMNTNYSTSSNRRAKTISSRRKKKFFG